MNVGRYLRGEDRHVGTSRVIKGVTMLKDRRVLVEQELDKARHDAAIVYMDMMRSSLTNNHENYLNAAYQHLTDKISDFIIELSIINSLIEQGHE
jgi:hypothetical protein